MTSTGRFTFLRDRRNVLLGFGNVTHQVANHNLYALRSRQQGLLCDAVGTISCRVVFAAGIAELMIDQPFCWRYLE
jgi:hypothetical protein